MVLGYCIYSLLAVFLITTVKVESLTGPAHDKVVVCYLTRWAAYRESAGKFDIFDIEPSLCTHIIYCFAGLDEISNKIKSLDGWQDLEDNYGRAGFKNIVNLKESNPHLKVSIAIGGWNEGSAKYSKMAADPKLRRIFVISVVNFMELYKFDGFDLSWDWPTERGGLPEDRTNYVSLIKELTEAFEPKGWLLTATLRTGISDMNAAYDLEQLNFYLDYMHLMTYDYHGPWDKVVGSNAPMRGYDSNDFLSIERVVSKLTSRGLNPNKLVLGLPMYGRTYTFITPNVREVVFRRTPTETVGFRGPFTGEDGFMGYNEICLQFTNKSSEWIYHWHNHTVTPYLQDDNRFITYDNPRSIASKVKLAMDNGFGGVTSWSIATDDFRGSCDEEPDTYIDFVERYNKIADTPLLKEALKNLIEAEHRNEFYILENGKTRLKLPTPKFANYPLLRTANEAIELALEENKVLYEMENVKNEKGTPDDTEETKKKGRFPCFRACSEICFYGV